jgi:hypothetical protein
MCETVTFREEDHKFEFTRSEFQKWALDICSLVQKYIPGLEYNARFFQVQLKSSVKISFYILYILYVIYGGVVGRRS